MFSCFIYQEVEDLESEKTQFVEKSTSKWNEILGKINISKKEYEEYEEQELNERKIEINRCEIQIKEKLKEMKNNIKILKVESHESKYNQIIRALLMEDMI